ncbi:unnamed protein product [Calicophoron daubneyi]|uniref:Selenocysteine lyase n=1 Tax=Calicophoron daubneyi TaxID=300641 RepID=A0AAV2TVS4_CALDB
MSVYLDYNSTTPLADEAVDAMMHAGKFSWQNPSCSYTAGLKVKSIISLSRAEVAKLLSVPENDIIFTSGGTESNFTVFNTFCGSRAKPKPHFVCSAVEHPSVLLPLKKMRESGCIDLTVVPINEQTGMVNVDDIVCALRPKQTALVSVMMANNETGAIMPVEEVVRRIRLWECEHSAHRVYIHSDMAQAIGKLPIDLSRIGVDYATIVGHKFYGPRIGCLYVRGLSQSTQDQRIKGDLLQNDDPEKAPLVPLFYGGGQEFGFRAGTENTPMIAGLGKAAALVNENLSVYINHMLEMRMFLEQSLKDGFAALKQIRVCIFGLDRCAPAKIGHVHGCGEQTSVQSKSSDLCERFHRLPNTVNITFQGPPWIDSRQILSFCPMLQASRGAACHSDDESQGGSSVLQSCGYSADEAKSAIRLSLGRETTRDDITKAVDYLLAAVRTLIERDFSGA